LHLANPNFTQFSHLQDPKRSVTTIKWYFEGSDVVNSETQTSVSLKSYTSTLVRTVLSTGKHALCIY